MQSIHITVLARETEKRHLCTGLVNTEIMEESTMKSLYEELGGTYTLGSDGMFYPDLTVEKTDPRPIGKWWYYYWGANIGDSSNDSLAGVQSFGYYGAVIKPLGENNFKILWGALDLDISNYNDAGIKCIQAAINNKFGKQCEYDKGIYFEGDFSNSWNNAQWRYNNPWALVYDPVFNNCSQTSLDILSKSIHNILFKVFRKEIRKLVIPKVMHIPLSLFGREFE